MPNLGLNVKDSITHKTLVKNTEPLLTAACIFLYISVITVDICRSRLKKEV